MPRTAMTPSSTSTSPQTCCTAWPPRKTPLMILLKKKAWTMISTAARVPNRMAAAREVRTPRTRNTSVLSNFMLPPRGSGMALPFFFERMVVAREKEDVSDFCKTYRLSMGSLFIPLIPSVHLHSRGIHAGGVAEPTEGGKPLLMHSRRSARSMGSRLWLNCNNLFASDATCSGVACKYSDPGVLLVSLISR